MLVTRVIRNHHCLHVNIPAEIYRAMNLRQGDLVIWKLTKDGHALIVSVAPQLKLADAAAELALA